jgi:ATP-dependent Clp protease adaptor protein ClpS
MTQDVQTPVRRPVEKTRPKRPERYVVVMLNDDFTPAEFVIDLLQRVFQKDRDEAVSTTLSIHNRGRAPVGLYPHEIAETKTAQVHRAAQQNGYPLRCEISPE